AHAALLAGTVEQQAVLHGLFVHPAAVVGDRDPDVILAFSLCDDHDRAVARSASARLDSVGDDVDKRLEKARTGRLNCLGGVEFDTEINVYACFLYSREIDRLLKNGTQSFRRKRCWFVGRKGSEIFEELGDQPDSRLRAGTGLAHTIRNTGGSFKLVFKVEQERIQGCDDPGDFVIGFPNKTMVELIGNP